MFANEAAFRMVIPGHDRPIFKGKVYVLMNGNTGSANEPLVDVLKWEGIATLVGSRTAGAMLSSAKFAANDSYGVALPVSDYVTARGTRLDKVGVEPDIRVAPGQELDHLLGLLQKKATK